jgi:large subunit ribosomal protein L6
MVLGVSKGFSKELEIQGVGFRAQMQGQKLVMSVGFSHPIEYMIPEGVKVEAPEATKIIVSGPDKQKVGAVSARIRDYCPAEPYKGKGIRYKDEHVRRKAGKTVA